MNHSEKIKNFHDLGLGLFVHFGLYSLMGKGEWVKDAQQIGDDEYDKLANKFCPCADWANRLCSFAKRNGFKYIVLTTRHHDGYSLYDTRGLNNFDVLHTGPKRDLVAEFVSACRRKGLTPFFYHTLIDWREEKKFDTFAAYLEYLRSSIKLLCENYGPIGGLWFDGQWKYPDYDWEWDKLASLIHKCQPNAMIVSNSGLNNLGARISDIFDSVTFERNNISCYDYNRSKDLFAAEMCQTLNSHWGFAKDDISYKSVGELLNNLCDCRKYGGNFLLNIGPMASGVVRPIDREIISRLGTWIKLHKEALYKAKPIDLELPDHAFALKDNNTYYIFITDTPMEIDENAGVFKARNTAIKLGFNVKRATWLDNGQEIELIREGDKVTFKEQPFKYGTALLTRVAKIEV